MNNRFYIKQIAASGDKKPTSTIEFEDGINIIKGPSNSGKSYVINCIDFMFAGKVAFDSIATGYNTISMQLKSINDDNIYMTRTIILNKNGKEHGDTFVKVESSVDEIENKKYKINGEEYSDLLLRIMGIKEKHSIIQTQTYKTQRLTVRSIIHFFFINEDNIFKQDSPIYSSGYKTITKNIAALKFLFDGDDLRNLVPSEREDEIILRNEKNKAIILYINNKIANLNQQKQTLENYIETYKNIDIDNEINTIFDNISSIEKELINATEKSKTYLKSIYHYSSKLEESIYLRDRYNALYSQYISDCERLEFIIEGANQKSKFKGPTKCPFCDGIINKDSKKEYAYIETAKKEFKRIKIQLMDLSEANKDINNKIKEYEDNINNLNIEHDKIKIIIGKELKPKVTELKDNLKDINKIKSNQQEISAIDNLISLANDDLSKFGTVDEYKINKLHAKDTITSEKWDLLNEVYELAVKGCGYPNANSVILSKDTMDGVINKKNKQNEGKGYRAFLNTVLLFALMKHLENHGTYKPSLLILDSPILSLKEKIDKSEHATESMKTSLFNYLINNCGDNQIIIAENEIPNTVDYSNVNIINFTHDLNIDRYGFLHNQN